MNGSFSTEDVGAGSGVLTVSGIPTAVPEAATWAMMVAGFGVVGGAIRPACARGGALRLRAVGRGTGASAVDVAAGLQ